MPTPNDIEALILAGMFPVHNLVVDGKPIRASDQDFGRWDTRNGTIVMVLNNGQVFVGREKIQSSEILAARDRLIRKLCPDRGVIVPGADLTKISAMQLASVAGCDLVAAVVG
jgi:hypothetical protein